MNAILHRGALKLTAAEHVVHMGHDLAEGKAHLMRIELDVVKENGNELRRRPRTLATRICDQRTAHLVMQRKLVTPLVQALERKLMPRHDKHVLRDGLLDGIE